MNRRYQFFCVIFIFVFLFCTKLIGQERDSLTLSWEVRLNERQPPDTVLKTIGIKPVMIIGEVGAGRGRYTVQIASRIIPSGRIYASNWIAEYEKYL